jgi:glycosyltransferase involved in cell wall biosynthesis
VTQPLTLCYVADATNIHVQRWLGFFVTRGHRVYCLSDKGGTIDGATVIDLPNKDSLAPNGGRCSKTAVLKARARKIRTLLKEIQPDVMHAIFLTQRGWSAMLSGFSPLVITLMGPDMKLAQQDYRHSMQLRRDQMLSTLSLKQCSMITAVSDDLLQAATQMTGGRIPVELVPIGTEPSLFRADLDTTILRERLRLPEDAFIVLSPRQMTPHYNQGTIIDSIPMVLKDVPHAIFIMKDTFGHTEERKAYVHSLKERAESLGVNHAIRWVEEVPLTELPLYYALCSAVVSVPSSDGMPVTIFEAMATQKPLIVGDLPSYNEVIIHGQTGLRVPIRNSQVLARAITKIHKNPSLARRMVEEAQVPLHQYGIFTEQMMRMERYYQGLKFGDVSPPSVWQRFCNGFLMNLLVACT